MSDEKETVEPTLTLNLQQIQGVQILINAAEASQRAGIFSLQDASLIFETIKLFVPEAVDQTPKQEEVQSKAS
jgi:hypothetical protein